MGFFDFLTRRNGSSGDRQVERLTKRLCNKHVQTGDRKRCIDQLEDLGTEEAVGALLQRFTFRTDVQIVDEDEKEQVYQALLRLGPRAIAPIRRFVHEETTIYWPLRALTEIAGEEQTVKLLIEEIDAITENFDRDVLRKHELVSNLRECQTPLVWQKLQELLSDEAEEIRILAVDGLALFDDPAAVEHLVPLLLNEEETHRVRQMIFDLLVDRQWSVKRQKKELTPGLPDHFWIDDTGIIRRK